jgi:long-chain acyl-CoA synthetase
VSDGRASDPMSIWGEDVHRRDGPGIPFLVYEPRPRSLRQVFAVGERWGAREHLVHDDRRFTFDDVVRAVRESAGRLVDSGISPGDRVLLIGTNSIPFVIAFWAVIEAGAVAVLGNGWWSEPEIDHAVRTVSPVLAIVESTDAAIAAPTMSFAALTDTTGSTSEALPTPSSATDEDGPAVILFTSGTTGSPKGAVLSHRACIALQHSLLQVTRRLPHQITNDHPVDVNLQTGPFFHIGGVQALVRAWLLGGTMVLPAGRFNPSEVVDLIESERVVRWGGVPTMVTRVLDVPGIDDRDLSSLRSLTVGGSPVSDHLLERIRAAFPNAAMGVSQIYGLSEAGGTLTLASAKDAAAHPGTVGRPLPVVDLRIEQPDEAGVGEILARSPAQMSGYFGITDDGRLDKEGWLRTGDLGRFEDGYLYLTGRSTDLIIRGGENVAPAHVEAVLSEVPGVREVAVLGLPDDDLGEIVAAVLTVDETSGVSADTLTEAARSSVAYFAVPSRWWIRTTPMPTNQAGKIDKRALLDAYPPHRVTDERTGAAHADDV